MVVVIIHRAERIDRAPHVNNLRKIFPNAIVFPAIEPSWELFPDAKTIRGCSLSHLEAVERFSKKGELTLVLEDDAVFEGVQEDLEDLQNLNELPKGVGIALLGGNAPYRLELTGTGFSEVIHKFFASHAVLYSPENLFNSPFFLNAYKNLASVPLSNANGACFESILMRSTGGSGLKIIVPDRLIFSAAEGFSDRSQKNIEKVPV